MRIIKIEKSFQFFVLPVSFFKRIIFGDIEMHSFQIKDFLIDENSILFASERYRKVVLKSFVRYEQYSLVIVN